MIWSHREPDNIDLENSVGHQNEFFIHIDDCIRAYQNNCFGSHWLAANRHKVAMFCQTIRSRCVKN